MAKESIDTIISQEALDQFIELGKRLDEVYLKMEQLIGRVFDLNKAMSSAGGAREAANAMNEQSKAAEELNKTNSERLNVERKIKEEGAKMAQQVKEETNNFEKLAEVMQKHAKTQGETAKEIVRLNQVLDTNKKLIKQLDTDLKNNKITNEQYIKSKTTLIQKQTTLKQALSDEQKSLKTITRELNTAEGSQRQMSARLTQLKSLWKGLTQEERENVNVGGVLKQEINNLDEALKGMEKSIGENQRSVGSYEVGIESLITKLPGFGGMLGSVTSSALKSGQAFGTTMVGALKSVGKAMLALMTNPLIALIAVLAMIIMGIVKAIKSNEEQMQRLQRAMAPLTRITELLLKLLQFVADILLDIIENAMKGIGMVMKLMENLPFVGDKIKAINEEIEEQNSLTERQQALVRRLREERILDAKDESRIAKLRLDASDKENVSAKDRIAMMKEANDLEDKRAERKIAALKEEYEIEHELNSINKTSAEGLDKENDLLVQIIQAETERDRLKKMNARQILAAEREINQEIKQREKIIQESNRRILELDAKTETDKLKVTLEKLKAEKTEKLKEHNFTEAQKAVITLQYEKERNAVIEAFMESQQEKRKQVLDEIRTLTKELNDWRINNEALTEEEIIAAYERNKEAEKQIITDNYNEKIKYLDMYSIEYIEVTNAYNLKIEMLEKQHQMNLTKIQKEGIDKRLKGIIDFYDANKAEIIKSTKNDEKQQEEIRQNDIASIDAQIAEMEKMTTWTQEDDQKHRQLQVDRDILMEQSADFQIKTNEAIRDSRMQATKEMVGGFAALGSAIAQNIQDEKQRMRVEAAIALVQALVNEGLAIAEAINDKGDPYTKAFRIIANVSAIVAAMVTATTAFQKASAAMPYADGTDFHKGGAALIGEAGEPEIVMIKNRDPFIIDKPTLIKDFPVGAKVIPMHKADNVMNMTETNELLKAIKNKATVNVNVSDEITTYIQSKLNLTKVIGGYFKA